MALITLMIMTTAAAALRDRIGQLRESIGKPADEVAIQSATRQQRGKRRGNRGRRLPRPKKSTS